jgi:membrane protein required for colicin V production
MIFSSANKAIPFLDEEDIESSVLYEPVRSIAPLIFTNIIKDDDVEAEETASSDTI